MPLIKQYETMEIDLSGLEENENNPRIIYPKQFRALNESLERFGNLGVVIFNKRSGRIVGGNQRMKILKEHGIMKTLGYIVDLDDDEELALLIELNNQGSMGSWDVRRAIDKVDNIRSSNPDLYDAFNFSALRAELDEGKPKKQDVKNEADVIPELEIMPFEHWDYVVVVFKDSRDWLAATEWFGLEKAKIKTASGKVKIGLGRAVDGAEFLKKIGLTKEEK